MQVSIQQWARRRANRPRFASREGKVAVERDMVSSTGKAFKRRYWVNPKDVRPGDKVVKAKAKEKVEADKHKTSTLTPTQVKMRSNPFAHMTGEGNRVLQEVGLTGKGAEDLMVAGTGSSPVDVLANKYFRGGAVAGVYMAKNRTVYLDPGVSTRIHEAADRGAFENMAEVQAVRTWAHEAIHSGSRGIPSGDDNVGVALEEASTELLARHHLPKFAAALGVTNADAEAWHTKEPFQLEEGEVKVSTYGAYQKQCEGFATLACKIHNLPDGAKPEDINKAVVDTATKLKNQVLLSRLDTLAEQLLKGQGLDDRHLPNILAAEAYISRVTTGGSHKAAWASFKTQATKAGGKI